MKVALHDPVSLLGLQLKVSENIPHGITGDGKCEKCAVKLSCDSEQRSHMCNCCPITQAAVTQIGFFFSP